MPTNDNGSPNRPAPTGPTDLRIVILPVDTLVPNSRNAHTHSPRQIRQIADSMSPQPVDATLYLKRKDGVSAEETKIS